MKKFFSSLMVGVVLAGGISQTASLVSAQAKQNDKGSAEVKVTYNTNIIDPDLGTDPDFAVLIPAAYQLSDKNQVSEGSMKLVDINDYTKPYAGAATLDVTVTSANHFVFANGGNYKLIDDKGALISGAASSSPVTMSSQAATKTIKAQLSKKADPKKENIAGVDSLTFAYTVK